MIIDIHSHAWKYPEHFNNNFRSQLSRARGGEEINLSVNYKNYLSKTKEDVKTIVFGGKARLSGLWVPDEYVAEYVHQNPEKLIGFLSLDPTQKDWQDEMVKGHKELGLKGIKLMPMYAGFNPNGSILDEMWNYASKNNLPVLLHTGTNMISQSRLEYTLPRHLDDVAIKFPDVRIIMAHLSHPYEGECVAVIRKHPNVYADISALYYRPWQFYNSLMLVQEYGVWDKVLFGSDYPFTNINDSLCGLRSLNGMLDGTKLPRLKEKEIEKIIYKDSLNLLGIK